VYKPVYQATVTAIVNADESTTSYGSSFGSLLGVASGGGKSDLLQDVVKSFAMRRQVVLSHHLQEHYKAPSLEKAVTRLGDNTHVLVTKSGLFTIGVTDGSPTWSASLANAYIDQIDKFNEEIGFSGVRPVLRVVDEARVPIHKVGPKRLHNVALSSAVAGFLAMICFLIYDTTIAKKAR
jgi:capsular polysaccharide biosynthesis protein